jgi:hypothetical protein
MAQKSPAMAQTFGSTAGALIFLLTSMAQAEPVPSIIAAITANTSFTLPMRLLQIAKFMASSGTAATIAWQACREGGAKRHKPNAWGIVLV